MRGLSPKGWKSASLLEGWTGAGCASGLAMPQLPMGDHPVPNCCAAGTDRGGGATTSSCNRAMLDCCAAATQAVRASTASMIWQA